MTVEQRADEQEDQFPVGMRVLAVDDDPTCLKLLETLLRRCQYHVTITSQAIMALKLLRENKSKFDLVISDVYMPDMDGFKLLELVGLEMDLPVIMLSANDDPKLVMQGISHGACDYLLKPVRIEELKNIWQHVVRRKKFDSRDHANKYCQRNGEGEQGPMRMENTDQSGKFKKRKDQNGDDDEECDENGNDNEDPSTQKKARLVWSIDLHRKFVAAVNQLGIEKAVPKRILELMNVEKITRENVASHLQKFRLYLKRINCCQQANMVAAFSSRDPSYFQMASVNGLGCFQTLSGSTQLENDAFRSFPPGGMPGNRPNTPANLGMRGLSPSRIAQLSHSPNINYTANNLTNLQPHVLPGNHNGGVLQGMPMSLEFDQIQQNKDLTHIKEFSNAIDSSTFFPISSGFTDTKVTIGSSSGSLLGVSRNTMMLNEQAQGTERRIEFGNEPSITMTSLNSEISSPLPVHNGYDKKCLSALQTSSFQSTPVIANDCFKQAKTYSGTSRESVLSIISHDVPSLPAQLSDPRMNLQFQLASVGSNVVQSINGASKQEWDQHAHITYPSNLMGSIYTSSGCHGAVSQLSQYLDPKNASCHGSIHFDLIGQSNVESLPLWHNEVEKDCEISAELKPGYNLGKGNPQGGYVSSTFGTLDDLVSVMMK